MKDKKLLDESALGKVNGGMDIDSDDPMMTGRCPDCSGLLEKTSYGFHCPSCGHSFDANKNRIDDVK